MFLTGTSVSENLNFPQNFPSFYMKKVRLPLSLLFACAVSATSVFGASTTVVTNPAAAVFADPLIGKQWQWNSNKNGISIAETWKEGITGSGVVIGIVDEWVEWGHEDLNISRYNPQTDTSAEGFSYANGLSADFVGSLSGDDLEKINEDTGDREQVYETENHGTFVAGMAAAIGGNDIGVVGAAPSATIAGLHVDLTNSETIKSAMYWGTGVSAAGEYLGEAQIQIKNNSWGSSYEADSYTDIAKAMEQTSANNVIYVFSAGNSRGEDSSGQPGSSGWDSLGNSKNLINVAATNSSGTYTDFSCFGSNVFITAPGADVVSTDRTGELGYNPVTSTSSDDETTTSTTQPGLSNTNYASSSGTSFSAPIVSGVLALGKQICTPMDVRWAKWALAYSSGHGESPNIDAVKSGSTYKQASNTALIEAADEGETPEITGEWAKNNGGYWFSNDYGFGLVDAESFVETVRNIAYTTVETTEKFTSTITKDSSSNETAPTTTVDKDVRTAIYNVKISSDSTIGNQNEQKTVSKLTSTIETVSVTVSFSAASTVLNLSSLKVSLVSPDGYESVLVQGTESDVDLKNTSGDGVRLSSYTFLSNAFWGSNYSSDTRDWTVKIEYDGVEDTDMTGFATVSSVDFTMGNMYFENSNLRVNSGEERNAHALVLDSGTFTVAGKFNVEDSIYINAGTFNVANTGSVGAVENSALKKGALFIQTGGTTSFAGSGAFARGVRIYGGEFYLKGSYTTTSTDSTATGTTIYGGEFHVQSGATSAGSEVSVEGGSFILENNSTTSGNNNHFSTNVTLNSGTFSASAGAGMSGKLSVLGGSATLNGETSQGVYLGSISVGASAVAATGTTAAVAAKGGTLSVAGPLRTASITLAGTGYASFAAGSIIQPLEKKSENGSILRTVVSVSDNATLFMNGGTRKQQTTQNLNGNLEDTSASSKNGRVEVMGDISVSGGTLVWTGDLLVTDLNATSTDTSTNKTKTGTLSVKGTGTLIAQVSGLVFDEGEEKDYETLLYTDNGATIDVGGTFYVGKTKISTSKDGSTTTDSSVHVLDYGDRSSTENSTASLTVRQGANLAFSARTETDYDFLDATDDGIYLEKIQSSTDKITVKYNFGDLIPRGNMELIRLKGTVWTEGAKNALVDALSNTAGIVKVELSGSDIPTHLDHPNQKLESLFFIEAPSFLENKSEKDTTDTATASTFTAETNIVLSSTDSLTNLDLHWASQTNLQDAVQMTLRSRLLEERAAEAADKTSPLSTEESAFLAKINDIDYKSELLGTYTTIGTPVNLIAIDELHDKQANAITGAISRRSREMRSGYIHLDTWSNPLFGNAGFSFSANPNLVAAKGFVPYRLEEEDFPLMIWANGGYSFSEADDGAMAVSSTKSSLLNVALGADFAVGEKFSLGLFGGFTNGRTKFDDGSNTDIQSRNIGAYANFCASDAIGSFFVNAMFAVGFEEYDFKRRISVVGSDYTATASPDGFQYIGFLEGGYEWKLKKWSTGPTLSLRYVANDIDDYEESAPLSFLAQKSDGLNYDSLLATASWRIAYRADFEKVSIMPEARVSWHHEFLGTDEDFDMQMASGNIGYTSTVASAGDDTMSVGLGLTAMLGAVSTLSVDYDYQFLRDDADPVHSVNVMFRTRF